MFKRVIGLWLVLAVIFPITIHAEGVPSIKELLEKASAGDVIQLENHVYEEDVVIDKSVVLKGDENTIIKGSGTGNVVTFEADGITLKNITITDSGTILDYDYAGIKIHSHHNKIIGVTIENSLHGIYLNESTGNEFIGNTITGNKALNQSRRGNGIHMFHASNNVIRENIIDGARDGIYFSFAEHNQVEKNQITNTRYGLHYMYSDHNEFYQNEFHDNVGGAAMMYSDFITLKENKFYDHHGLQSFGILLQTANDVHLEKNQIHFNQKGIFMDQSNRNVLKNNHITNNRIGLDIWASSKDNTLTGNQILENSLAYSSNGGEDANSWSDKGIGNAWSGNTLTDLDQNGIGDAPFVYTSSYGQVIADQQLGALFLDSPALMLYEKWNQLFGSDTGKIVDEHPLRTKQDSVFSLPIILIALSIGLMYRLRKWHVKIGRS